jgi:hypothetical protein
VKGAIFAALLLFAACGRVGDPLPPIIRIPQKVENLTATQTGYDIVLNWTSPPKYVDGNPATDTGVVHVFQNSLEIGRVAAAAAGQPQSFRIGGVRSSVGATLEFTVQLVVPRGSKPSPVSNPALIQPVDVPGSPQNLQAVVDKNKISLTWEQPALNPQLVDAYVVQRSDKPAAPYIVRTPSLEDEEFEAGKTYTYTVTAVRGTNPQIPGEGKQTLEVVAKDETRPATPTGLELELLGDTVFLKWEANTEPDLKGYQLFRSDRPEQPIFTGNLTGHSDLGYVPGRGLSYWILAEDVSGNPSPPSARLPGP